MTQSDSIQPLNLGSLAAFQFDTSGLTEIEGGGVTSAAGFRAAGIHAGFRKEVDRLDLALVAADELASAAGVFTQNVFCAAPVIVSREHLEHSGGRARALVVNSGVANAATGDLGLRAAEETAEIAADALHCSSDEVLVASTGVIGQHLPLDPFRSGIPAAVAELSAQGGALAARAIMSTDTHPKEIAVSFSGDGIGYDGCTFTVGGMAKGAGMIMPDMATMIAVLTTDAPVNSELLARALGNAVELSFNRITVDSDTSTNDSCFIFASGAAAPDLPPFTPGSPAYDRFEAALRHVAMRLARDMAADGEGATRLVTVRVAGAVDDDDAQRAARTVANSPLVKTAIFGHDANWGRIAGALGRSGAQFRQEKVSIDIMGIPVCRQGLTVSFDEEEALRRFEAPEIVLEVDLGAGCGSATIWTCDLTYDYVMINGEYRT